MSVEEQEIPENAIICKVVEQNKRNYIELPLYGDKKVLVGSPDKRVLDLFAKNEFEYNELPSDRNWHRFCNNIKRRKVWALVKQINRTRALSSGKVQDIYTVYVGFHGENNKQMHEQDSRMIGVWRQPKFTKERDLDTEQLKTTGVEFSTRLFEFTIDVKNEESVNAIKYLQEHLDPEAQFNVSPTPDAKSETVYDPDGFAIASFAELLQMAQRKVGLADLREFASMYYPKPNASATGKGTTK
jgi:hypothetical protein